jgi:hypothetical protein
MRTKVVVKGAAMDRSSCKVYKPRIFIIFIWMWMRPNMGLKTFCINIFYFINLNLSIPDLLRPYNFLLFLIFYHFFIPLRSSEDILLSHSCRPTGILPPVCIILFIICLKSVEYFVYPSFSRRVSVEPCGFLLFYVKRRTERLGNYQILWAQYFKYYTRSRGF